MGAGSAKGRPGQDDDDQDRLSSTSSEKWGNNSDDEFTQDHDKGSPDAAPESPSFDPGPSDGGINGVNHLGDDASQDQKGKGEAKRRFGFNFNRSKTNEDPNKGDDSNESEGDKKKKDDKKDSKKDGESKGGFKLFGWRNKKSEEPDPELEKDIDDLEKTFDSLGIVGKNMWGEDKPPNPRKEAVDDLELLEPMRKRKNVRVRGTRGLNGTISTENQDPNMRKHSNASSGSRRTYKFSWETEKKASKPVDEDEWEYKAVVIEGFDIDKFRKANKKDTVFDSASLPNAVSGEEYEEGRPVLRYDQNEQQILASIERDFTFN